MRKFYSSFVHPRSLCFDIGANVGNYTDTFLRMGARVVSVEPISFLGESLKNRFGTDKNFHYVQAAVGGESGIFTIYICNENEVSSLSPEFINYYKRNPKLTWSQTESVRVITLNELIEEFGIPDFCKMDIEGYEFEALQALKHRIPSLSFEFNFPFKENAIKCIELMSRFSGAKFNYSAYRNYQFELKSFVTGQEMIEVVHLLPPSILTGDIFVQLS